MNTRRTGFALVTALALSFLLTLVLRQTMLKASMKTSLAVHTHPVLVATKDLLPGDLIGASSVQVDQWPDSVISPKSFARLGDMTGHLVQQAIYAGEPVRAERFTKAQEESLVEGRIPLGMRAVTVNADDTARIGGLLERGSLVDVLVNRREEAEPVSETVLQGVRVLAMGEQALGSTGANSSWSTLTLLVTPQQAARLGSALECGKLMFSLRNRVDLSTESMSDVAYGLGAGKRTLTSSNATRSARTTNVRVDPPFTVEVVAGGKHSSQSFGEVRP